MKLLLDLIVVFLAVMIHALISYLAWNYIAADLFTFLPTVWHHLGYLQMFAVLWVIRGATMILRTPYEAKANVKDK